MNTHVTNNYTLENIYEDDIAQLKKLFLIYKDIYQLPEYLHKDKDVVPDAFDYAKKRLYFVILVLHTKDGEVCFQRSFDDGHLSLNLPGSSIRLGKEDTIITAINRVANKSFKDARIADIAPIISLTNRFYRQNGETFEHHGLGIRALLLNDVQDVTNISREILYKGKFSKTFPCDEIPHPPAKETYKVFKEWFRKKRYTTYTNEIETQHKFLKRYFFHQTIINPFLKGLSYVIGKHPIKNVKIKMLEKMGRVNKAIDVACGDDRGIFDQLCKAKILIANDISIDQIACMKKKYNSLYSKLPKSNSLMFTNHDCLDLPFRDKTFDVAICSNLLHHMNTANDLKELLKNIKRVAKRIIISEIQDPNKENVFGRLRHRYYLKFLKDEGKHFYSKDDFENIIGNEFEGSKIEFEYLSTIRGLYMFAEVINRNEIE